MLEIEAFLNLRPETAEAGRKVKFRGEPSGLHSWDLWM